GTRLAPKSPRVTARVHPGTDQVLAKTPCDSGWMLGFATHQETFKKEGIPPMKYLMTFLLVGVAVLPALGAGKKTNRSEDAARLRRATEVFHEIMATPDKGIPQDLLDKASCVAIIPGVTKGGIGLGGAYGRGVVMCRGGRGTWSAPAFLTVEGGSFGL